MYSNYSRNKCIQLADCFLRKKICDMEFFYRNMLKMKKIIACVLVICNSVCCVVIEAPQNALVFVGQTTSFKCTTKEGSTVREWSFSNRSSESNPSKIFSNWIPSTRKLNSDRYNVDVDEFGSGVLYLNDTQLEDAGTYKCLAENGSPGSQPVSHSAELIVLASDPKCGSHDDSIFTGVKEGSNASIWCNVSYAGTFIPVARWFRNSREIALPTESENQVNRSKWFYFNTTFLLNSSDNGMVFSCEIRFEPTNTSGSNLKENRAATNVPDYVYKWNVTANVWYEPRDIRIEPRKTIYAFGDRLHCSADGNPPPNYTWSSVLFTHLDHRAGPVLVIEENTFNDTQFYSYRCTAFSSIFAANISAVVNFTIGPSTVVRWSVNPAVISLGSFVLILLSVAVAVVVYRIKGKQLKLCGKYKNGEDNDDEEELDMANVTSAAAAAAAATSSNALGTEAPLAAAPLVPTIPTDSGDETLPVTEFPNTTDVYSNLVGIRSPPTALIYTELEKFAPPLDDSETLSAGNKDYANPSEGYINVSDIKSMRNMF